MDQAQFGQGCLDLRLFRFQLLDFLRRALDHEVKLFFPTLTFPAVKIQECLDVGEFRSKRLGPEDQAEPGSVSLGIDTLIADAARF